MKSFRTIMAEVAQPRSPEEKKFKDMHSYETKSHPVAPDAVFTGAIGADDLPREKAKRKADQDGDANYDKQFKEGKAYGPTGVSYYVPDGHEDEVDPATGKKKNSKKEGLDYNPAKGEYNQKPGKEVGKRVGTREAADPDKEELDEISKTKIGQYINRAHSDKDTQTKRAGIFDKKGMDADKDKDMYKQFDNADKARKKAANRTAGIGKAVDKLTREELELEISEDLKMVSRQEHPKGGHIVTLQDKNGKKIVRHLNKGKVTDMKSEEVELDEAMTSSSKIKFDHKPVKKVSKGFSGRKEAERHNDQLVGSSKASQKSYVHKHTDNKFYVVDEGSIKGSGTDRKSVLKKAFRSGEQDTRQFNTPGGAATNKPKRGSDATVKKAYQAGRDSEQGDSAYKGTRRSKPQDTLGYKKNEAVYEGILDNIKKKVNDVRRKVVGPNQAEKDAARKKMMARQHASTMKNIGSAMGAVAKKDKAAEVARLKQGLKNVENQRKESVDLDETTNSALMKPVTTTTPDGKKRTVMKTIKNNSTDDHGQDIIKSESGVNPLIKAVTGGKQKIKEALKANILESLAQADVKETE